MPANPDMSTVMSQMAQMQSAQASSTNMLASAIGSLQSTISQMASATQLGVATAYAGGQTALQSLQIGAATAMGDVSAVGGGIGQALQAMGGPAGAGPPVPGMGMAGGGGGMAIGPGNAAYGASIGALSLVGAAGGYAAWEATSTALGAGFRAATGAGAGFTGAVGRGATLGARMMGGAGIRGAIGGAMGGGAVALGAIAIPMAAALAAEEIVNIGVERMGAVRDVESILAQQAGRITPFDPGAGIPTAAQFRGVAGQIVGDLAGTRGIGAGGAAQFISQAAELGLFTGAGADPQGIRGKARELADAVKEMTKLLGTSMEESLTMMAELRQVGFEGAAAPGAVLASRGRGRLGGFTGAEMHAVGMRGAQAFRGMGISPAVGFNAGQSNLAQISDMVNNNLISNDLVSSMGGRQRMAEQMTQAQAGFLQTGAGQAFLASAAQGRGGAMAFIGGQQDLASAAMMGLGGGGDPRDIAAFLGRRGRIAQELGAETIGAGQVATLREMVERSGFQIRGLGRVEQQDVIAGIAMMGQGALGIQGPEQAVLLATQLMAAPQTLARQAQAMRSESWRETLTRYNEQNVGFSGAWFKTTTFFNELSAGVGEPFAATRNVFADTYDDVSERWNDWYNDERTEILSRGNVSEVSKQIARDFRDPKSAKRRVNRVLDEDSIARIKKKSNIVQLEGTIGHIKEQLAQADGDLTLLGTTELTTLEKLGDIAPLASSIANLITGPRERIYTVAAVRTSEIDAIDAQATEMNDARLRRFSMTDKQKETLDARINETLKKPMKLSFQEQVQIGHMRFTNTSTSGNSMFDDWRETGDKRDINLKALGFVGSKKHSKAARLGMANTILDQIAGDDPKKRGEVANAVFTSAPEILAELTAGIDEADAFGALKPEEEKLRAEAKQHISGFVSEFIGGQETKEKQRVIERNADLFLKLADARTDPFVAARAAEDLVRRTRGTATELDFERLVSRARGMAPEELEKFREVVPRLGAMAFRRRFAEQLKAQITGLETRIEEGGERIGETERNALRIAQDQLKAFTQVGGLPEVNRIVDAHASQAEDIASLKLLEREGGAIGHMTKHFRIHNEMTDAHIRGFIEPLTGDRKVKRDEQVQAKVEAFQEETIKGFSGINQTISDNLALSRALLIDAQRLGITSVQTSRGEK